MDTSTAIHHSGYALGRAVGHAAFIWGYPLVEMVRTCRLQTLPAADSSAQWRSPIDVLHRVDRVATDADRDVVTPANDLLYTTGWMNLANGPRLLHVPSSRRHGGRYFVLALYDAWTNNFENPGLRASPPEGESVLLVRPGTPRDQPWPAATRTVEAPTDLVWLIGRVVAGDGDDVLRARALQADIQLQVPSGSASEVPAAARSWVGPVQDETIDALLRCADDAPALADAFLINLCHALAEQAVPAPDTGMLSWIGQAGLRASPSFDLGKLRAPVREGLRQGVLEAAQLVCDRSRSQVARPWAVHYQLGRYGQAYLARAVTAYKGLGALAPEEAIYAMADFDTRRQALDGRHRYTLRFEPGQLPPVDGFWSVTLYAADRYLHPNPIGRHSLGDRALGLKYDVDGGLTLDISHPAPHDTANWLPAPAGLFYLVLRLYVPRAGIQDWPLPVLSVQHEGRS